MTDAIRDGNFIPVALGVSSSDATVPLPFQINGSGQLLVSTSGGSGDVVGPASATDNALVIFNGTTGKLIKDSTIKLVTTVFSPTTNDGVALGSTALSWSDLFLASGAVINIANGNWVATHTSGILTVTTGDLRVTSANVGTNADSVPTLSSTSTLTNKTLTAPTIGGAATLADAATLSLIVPTVDGTCTGPTTSDFVSGYTSSAVGDLVILDSSGKWQKTDANTSSIYDGIIGVALAVAATNAALKVALPGSFVYATGFPTLTVGGTCYMSETAGAITQTKPTTTDAATRAIGVAVHADKIYFFPSMDYITHT